ncbi:MAG: hypothetical protein FWD17_02060 [Polyangiaceae bacterium]|nr:hypothetical protein [Polyangiaceae bacterium]
MTEPRPGIAGAWLVGAWVVALVSSSACGPADSPVSATPVSRLPASSGPSSTAAPERPLVAVVDTDRVLTATPGQGVGVFTEYQGGGHWHVWWICDTAVTQSPCAFEIHVTSSGGAISNVQSEGIPVRSWLSGTAREVTASTVTSRELDGVTFDAPAGQAIEVDAQVNGTRDGRFLFFVQDGTVNGGYAGRLTNPLVFSPSSP